MSRYDDLRHLPVSEAAEIVAIDDACRRAADAFLTDELLAAVVSKWEAAS